MANHPTVRLLRVTNNEQSPYSEGDGSTIRFQSNDSDLHSINRIHLKTSIIPNTQYNINTKNNTLLVMWSEMSGPVPPLPVGQYTIATFCTALETALNSVATTGFFTVTVNPLTYKITITTTGPNFIIADKTLNPMFMVIGQVTQKTSVGGILVCDNIYNLSGLRHVYIESFTLGKSLLTGSVKKYSIIADIPITVPFGAFQSDIHTEETLNVVYYRGFKNLSNFQLNLVNELGEPLELNGAPFTLVFEIHSS